MSAKLSIHYNMQAPVAWDTYTSDELKGQYWTPHDFDPVQTT